MSYIRQKSSLLLLYSNDGWSVLDYSALKIEKNSAGVLKIVLLKVKFLKV